MSALLPTFRRALRSAREHNTIDFFPLPKSLAGYDKPSFRGDLRAGINVALLAFPQGMAYALIAGLPIQYGVYGSAIAAMVAPLFARDRFITLGPTNATSVMLLSSFAAIGMSGGDVVRMLPLLILMVGAFIIFGALFKVANLIQYISRSVITGYISAAALLIITNQIPKALGLSLEDGGATFFDTIAHILRALETVHPATLAVSATTAIVYLAIHRWFRGLPNVAVTLVIVSALTAFFARDVAGLKLLPPINPSNWTLDVPEFSMGAFQKLASPAIAIALLCILEGISIGKSLAAKTGARLDANQAMFSIGMANVGCAFLSGMPASGSLTRSTLTSTSGGATPLASYISGVIVFVGAFTVGPFTRYIPQCTLAVLVIMIGISLINVGAIRIVTKATKSDAAVFGTTFVTGLFLPLDTAIYVGVGTSIILFLKKVARPEMVEYAFNETGQLAQMEEPEQRSMPEVSIVHVEGELFFGAAELFRDQMRRICEDPNLKIVVLKMRNAHNMDATGVMALEELIRYMQEKGRYLILSEVKADLIRVLKNSGLYDVIEERNIFTDDPHNPTLSTAMALKRAQEHLGDAEANVSIYVDPVKDHEKKKDETQ